MCCICICIWLMATYILHKDIYMYVIYTYVYDCDKLQWQRPISIATRPQSCQPTKLLTSMILCLVMAPLARKESKIYEYEKELSPIPIRDRMRFNGPMDQPLEPSAQRRATISISIFSLSLSIVIYPPHFKPIFLLGLHIFSIIDKFY